MTRSLVAMLTLVALGAVGSAGAQAKTGAWKAVVRIVPNPLPAGRCAAIRVELQDDAGYQSSQLPDGRAMDSRRFKYESTNGDAFRWQNDDPSQAYLCAQPDAKPARTLVTVTLANGLSGSTELTSLAPGQTAAPVMYPPQAPLRLAGQERRMATSSNAPADQTAATAPPATSSLARIQLVAPITFSGTNFVAGTTFGGRIVVPLDLKSLSSVVRQVKIVCRIKPPDSGWDEGVAWKENIEQTVALPSEGFNTEFSLTNYVGGLPTQVSYYPQNGRLQQTLGASFSATRSKGLSQGEVWPYSCSIWLGRGGQGINVAEWAEAGSGASYKDWAQVAVGSAKAEGTFVVR